MLTSAQMLKRALLIVALLIVGAAAVLALHLATATGDTVFSWHRPDNLGAKDGRLAPPKRTPNCVSSQADPADASRQAALSKTDSPLVELAVPQPAVPAVTRI